MKKTAFLLALLGVVLTGCATRYSILLSNGETVTAMGKPHFDKASNRYYYKDASGQPSYVSAMQVREVGPSSMVGHENSTFIGRSSK